MLAKWREAVQGCKGCPLYRNATQAVRGEGRATARIVMIGEQPGDQEDLVGRPFFRSGRQVVRSCFDRRRNRSDVYVTNAVKHFKFEERGKRRIQKEPSVAETRACKPWLEA